MKIQNIKVGMKVIDKLGNEYDVVSVGYNITKLVCTKFVEAVRVDSIHKFQKIGDCFSIGVSEEDIKNCFGYDVDITIKSIKPINQKKILKKFLKSIDKIEENMHDDPCEADYELYSLKQQLIAYFGNKK